MKIFSKMLSKKPEATPALGHAAEDEQPALTPLADDTGRPNRSKLPSQASAAPDASLRARDEEPEVAGSGWGDSDWDDDDWDDDDEDWGEDDAIAAADPEERRRTADRQHLVSEIRDAMDAVKRVRSEPPAGPSSPLRASSREMSQARPASRETSQVRPSSRDWSEDEDFGRKALARTQLGEFGGEAEDRILEKTEHQMTDRETSRRRSAMAHLKAAAAATKADRVLSHVAGRDSAADSEEQSPYRDDLAKVVRPHSTSRPISRVVSRPNTRSPIWDQGTGDEDAALYAASEDGFEETGASIEAELAAAEAERLARAPADLSEEDFSDDAPFAAASEEAPEFPASRFAGFEEDDAPAAAAAAEAEESDNAFGDFGDDEDYDYEDEDDDFAPRPSRVVSEAVAFANAPDEEPDTGPEESEVRKKIWEMADEVASTMRANSPEAAPENFVEVASVVTGRAGRSAGRVKTRLLGFQAEDQTPKDVFQQSAEAAAPAASQFPAGWIVVVSGPGRGACFTLHTGVSQIGRGEDQAVRLDFGDNSISRNNHAAVAYDDEQGKFYLGHGGKSNLVRLNGMPVLSTEEMSNGDVIRIGETTLKFVALCGEAFTWSSQGDSASNA